MLFIVLLKRGIFDIAQKILATSPLQYESCFLYARSFQEDIERVSARVETSRPEGIW